MIETLPDILARIVAHKRDEPAQAATQGLGNPVP
jgi:hypothetical protein